MLLIQDGRPQAMLLGKKKTIISTCKIGYLDLFRPSLKGLSIIYRGFLGRQTQEVCHTFLGHLTRILRDGDCDMVEFEYLPIDSLMYKLATTIPKTLTRGHFPKADSHWGISVPRNIDIFYNRLSKKHRYNLQRSMRLLEDQHSVRVKTYRGQDDLEEAIALAAQISPKTYQHAYGWGFVDDDNTRHRLAVMAKFDWLRFHFLFVDDKPCAFQLGLQYQRTYFAERRGFDADLKNLSVGTALFLKVLEELCKADEADFIDFTTGDAEFKHLICDKQWPEASAYIFAPRFYPICVNILSSMGRGITLVLEWLIRKIGLEHQIKNALRNLLRVCK